MRNETIARRRRGAALATVLAVFCLQRLAPAEERPAPVGLEARGVDPREALRHGASLDVRDAFNRPVSAALVERQIKTALGSAAESGAPLSRLPRAAQILRAVEGLVILTTALVRDHASLPQRAEAGLCSSQRGQRAASSSVKILIFRAAERAAPAVAPSCLQSNPTYRMPLRC